MADEMPGARAHKVASGETLESLARQAEFSDGTVKEDRIAADGRAWVPGPRAGNAKVGSRGTR